MCSFFFKSKRLLLQVDHCLEGFGVTQSFQKNTTLTCNLTLGTLKISKNHTRNFKVTCGIVGGRPNFDVWEKSRREIYIFDVGPHLFRHFWGLFLVPNTAFLFFFSFLGWDGGFRRSNFRNNVPKSSTTTSAISNEAMKRTIWYIFVSTP